MTSLYIPTDGVSIGHLYDKGCVGDTFHRPDDVLLVGRNQPPREVHSPSISMVYRSDRSNCSMGGCASSIRVFIGVCHHQPKLGGEDGQNPEDISIPRGDCIRIRLIIYCSGLSGNLSFLYPNTCTIVILFHSHTVRD